MKIFAAFDLVVLGYIAVVSVIVLVFRPPGTLVYLGYHAAMVGMIAMIVHAHVRFGGRFWTFLRYWYVPLAAASAFREIFFLVPQVHPFNDNAFDQILNSLDRRWFGDVDGFFLSGWSPYYIDLLHLCYWFYFVSTMIIGGALFARSDWGRLREYLSVVMTALLLSYLGYFLVPAIGPHHFYQPRPAQLDGWLLGRKMHEAILAAEWRTPDAFPSGHALLSMVVITMSWRLHRPSFRWVLAPAIGCIVATVALRYHYVVDVVASAAIFPGTVGAGIVFNRWWERPAPVLAPEKA
jgi:hypothetical protein